MTLCFFSFLPHHFPLSAAAAMPWGPEPEC